MRLRLLLSTLIAIAQPGFGQAQSVDAGEKGFRTKCLVCHSINPDGKPGGMGPNLRGVVGRKAGEGAFKNYSPAIKNSNLVWDAKTLEAFLAAPSRVTPGTRMSAPGATPEQRQAIIEYLSRTK